MIRAVLFDAVGTVLHVKPSVAELYVDAGQRFGSRLDADEIRRRFPIAFARQDRIDETAGWCTGEERERMRWRDIVAEVLDDVADPAACYDELFAMFRNANAWTCDPHIHEVLCSLDQRGIQAAIASNFDGRLHGLISAKPELRNLTQVFISSEIGWRKPAPQFFAHAVATLSLRPREILFVGDDRTNDYDAALLAGMSAVLFDPRRMYPDLAPNRIETMTDLLSYVESD